MNRILVFVFFMACAFAAQGQGNLQFNQTKFIKLSAPLTTVSGGYIYGADSTTITVPVGKTLKIESASVGVISVYAAANIVYPNIPWYSVLSLDNTMIVYAASSTAQPIPFPIWLPAGNYKLILNSVITNSITNYIKINGFISAIEFNIIP